MLSIISNSFPNGIDNILFEGTQISELSLPKLIFMRLFCYKYQLFYSIFFARLNLSIAIIASYLIK